MTTANSIKALQDKMINVTLDGTVRKVTELLSYTKGKGGKYFAFYLYESEQSSIRLTAYNQCAEKLYPSIKVNQYVRVTKLQIKQTEFNGVKELQGTLTLQSTVAPLEGGSRMCNPVYTPIAKVGEAQSNSVDVVGMIVDVHVDVERIMADGATKSLTLATIQDETAQIDVTFWEYGEKISEIPAEQWSVTSIALEGSTVNRYLGVITLNVNRSTIVTINPDDQRVKALGECSFDDVCLNLSQRSGVSSIDTHQYPTEVIVDKIKRDLKKLDEEEEEIKIKRYHLEQELKYYNST